MDAATTSAFCEICGHECETEDLVRLHMKEEHGRRGSQCPFCDLSHINVDQLNFHVNTAHADILSPLRSKSSSEPYLLVENNRTDPNSPHLIEVSPEKVTASNSEEDCLSPDQGFFLSPDKEFCSPKKGLPSSIEMDSKVCEEDANEALPMEVFHNSNESLPSSSSCLGSSEGPDAQDEDEGSPLKRVMDTLSPLRWSLRRDKNKVLKDVKGLWKDVPSTSGSEESLEAGDLPWLDQVGSKENMDRTLRDTRSVSETKPKETLLTISKHAKHIEEPVLCPFCGLGDYDPVVIQQHVEVEHSEIESDETLGAEKSAATGMQNGFDKDDPHRTVTSKRKLYDHNSNVPEDSKRSCPVCHLKGLPEDKIDDHVNSHFEPKAVEERTAEDYDRLVAHQIQEQEKQLQKRREEEHFKLLKQQYGMDEKGNYQKQAETNLDRALVRGDVGIADYYHQKNKLNRVQATGEEDARYRTSGVITALSRFYHGNVYNVDHARLAEQTDHFASSPGCKGWGCGYRNLQMLLSAMWHNPDYRQVVFNGRNAVPSIPYIQRLIESAWKKGFDPAGMEQLGNRLVNTRKWIGATEITALLQSLRVKCRLVDFHKTTGPGGTHPRMFEWVRDYFGRPPIFGGFGREEAAISKKMPLYLQHQGHSRTIIGCEVMKDNSIRLLLFDPSAKSNDMAAFRSGNITGTVLRPLRKTLGQMKHKQYQIVAVTGLISSDREYEESKLLVSVRVP